MVKMREKERMEELLNTRIKLTKPGHRSALTMINLDDITDNDDLFISFPPQTYEDDDDIPEFMEPPVESLDLSVKQLRNLRKKYELYLIKKAEDLIAEGPIIRSDCEDLICNSCKITVEEIGNSIQFNS